LAIPGHTTSNSLHDPPLTGKTYKTVLCMATPRKRLSSGFSEAPIEEVSEEKELEESLNTMPVEIFEEGEAKEEPKEAPRTVILPEISPTEDPGTRFVEQPVVHSEPIVAPVEHNKPRPHPRNIPRFTRFAK
jgi:hypothetical protein